jgi:hypothetical protein
LVTDRPAELIDPSADLVYILSYLLPFLQHPPPQLQITYAGAQETLNNMRCRVRCAASGFSMSATSAQTCFCGNNYPSIFHRVPDSQCSKPCSPDRTVCEGAGCCGDKVGKYYTVSFAKEIDVTLQLLRTLTYDYRSQNKRFQQYIESKIASTAALQVAWRCSQIRSAVTRAAIGLS